MWILEPNQNTLGKSEDINANFLYQEGKTFVMDNHLCAAWCWLTTLNSQEGHNLLHIDKHYDLTNSFIPQTQVSRYLKRSISFDEYDKLEFTNDANLQIKIFKWDNYIFSLKTVYPKFFNKTYFATDDYDSNRNNDFVISEEINNEFLLVKIDELLAKNSSWIFNLDFDYFFEENGNKQFVRKYDDSFVEELAKMIKKHMDDISVLSLSLSPECCGSWQAAFEVAIIFCDTLGLNFTEEILDKNFSVIDY